ncbi:hypothetical protein LEP1GSC081_2216 [Leptospira kirschneri str. H1]|uniref:Uncharacterized protein n=1 Tax=Leptospira kirschneri str. H1 TaxID=1049966 RepID=A0A0E2B8K3_9LEPT|nr:hypothetical protein LEP1GSC081_2216 [Leptospira kirschneri str. H1]
MLNLHYGIFNNSNKVFNPMYENDIMMNLFKKLKMWDLFQKN